ncbi:hypothetical protein [Mucilaginibacter sp. CSA2-8R]|uniref:hypothetical protein n=1 Tax=Mucilaginibacter sp. CSA2-8R TaxID=3141542 RepID=UPI00315D95B9
MYRKSSQKLFSASQETDYLAGHIQRIKLNCVDTARIDLNYVSVVSQHQIEHDLLMPLINDAFEFGIPDVEKPIIIFDLQLEDNRLTVCVHYKRNMAVFDERTQATFLRLRRKLEALYPNDYLLYRDYYLDNYLVFAQINLT